MKKEDRTAYISLSEAINAVLCTFCTYADYQWEGCCEGWAECKHPIETLSYQGIHEEGLEPGCDCYAFRPSLPLDVSADLAGAILAEGYHEWFYRKFSRRSVTVYGRCFSRDGETSGKVRIG